MLPSISAYHQSSTREDQLICQLLAGEIIHHLPDGENKIWHAHPVWFLNGNPIVGFSRLKECIRLLFWSGESFEEEGLPKEGGFKSAGARYTHSSQINVEDLARWLAKARTIQWDYKSIVKRKGVLEKLFGW